MLGRFSLRPPAIPHEVLGKPDRIIKRGWEIP